MNATSSSSSTTPTTMTRTPHDQHNRIYDRCTSAQPITHPQPDYLVEELVAAIIARVPQTHRGTTMPENPEARAIFDLTSSRAVGLTTARHQAIAICRSCPCLAECRRWLESLDEHERPRGIVAGILVPHNDRVIAHPTDTNTTSLTCHTQRRECVHDAVELHARGVSCRPAFEGVGRRRKGQGDTWRRRRDYYLREHPICAVEGCQVVGVGRRPYRSDRGRRRRARRELTGRHSAASITRSSRTTGCTARE